MIRDYETLIRLFTPPERTRAGIPFGNPPDPVTFDGARVVVYGVCFDETASFGRSSHLGPEAMRNASGKQVETYCLDEGCDIYQKVPVFDLGDFRIRGKLSAEASNILHDEYARDRKNAVAKLEKLLKQFDGLRDVTQFLRTSGKIPLMLGGEHTLSYWTLSGVAPENPVVIHFDAHRDAKQEYCGMRLCHTTPMYHYLTENRNGRTADFVQIGIRQADVNEERFAKEAGIITFYPRDIRERPKKVASEINRLTAKRNVYITFDMDVLDCCYTPCTGTPEPFGLRPEEVVGLIKSVNKNSRLIGADCVEVGAKKDDFREGTIATQILLRLLARNFVRN